jgi:hypothetical protein
LLLLLQEWVPSSLQTPGTLLWRLPAVLVLALVLPLPLPLLSVLGL